MGDGLADVQVREHGPLQVEAHGHDAVGAAGIAVGAQELDVGILIQAGLVRTGHTPQPLHVAGFQGDDLAALLRVDPHHDLIELGKARLPVVRIALQTNL